MATLAEELERIEREAREALDASHGDHTMAAVEPMRLLAELAAALNAAFTPNEPATTTGSYDASEGIVITRLPTDPPAATVTRYALADHERLAVAIRALQDIKERTSGDDDQYQIWRAACTALSTINVRKL